MGSIKSFHCRSKVVFSVLCLLFRSSGVTSGFVHQQAFQRADHSYFYGTFRTEATTKIAWTRTPIPYSSASSTTSLNVWWFGGTEQNEVNNDKDSCELVAVRIERTSSNSRRIAGEITVPATLDDVWSILTDYDRLAIHVPNLMESRITQRTSAGEPGDGSFRCRLFQKGAQKIIGFDFSASVTMDMTEKIISASNELDRLGNTRPHERAIGFKCVESQFFTNFDGEWRVKEQVGFDGEPETLVSYVVDVRPKGPVPVAALEWRIREDVPTNLRAVKAASLKVGQVKTIPVRTSRALATVSSYQKNRSLANSTRSTRTPQRLQPRMVPVMSDWDRDETMAKYL